MTRWEGTTDELRRRVEAAGARQPPEVWQALAAAPKPTQRASKYGNVPTIVDGLRFASQAEARRYIELRLLERAGEILNLVCQPRYVLGSGKKPPVYVADFAYSEAGRQVAEDVKGGEATQTPVFKLKAKLFCERYPHVELRIVK